MNEELRYQWYNKSDVQQNIIPSLRGTEMCFLVPNSIAKTMTTGQYPVRCLKAHASSFMINHMAKFNFFNRQYNLYHSIYQLDGMPMMSYKPLERKEQQVAFFKNYEKYVTGVIFVMDFDGDEKLPITERLEQARKKTKKVCDFMSNYAVPYNVVFSGTKGFHVEVRDFAPTQNWKKQTEQFREIAMRLVLLSHDESVQSATSREGNFDDDVMQRFSLHSWDELVGFFIKNYSFDIRIYNQTRIWKVPYSYDVLTDCIVLPLTDAQLDQFKIEEYRAEKLIHANLWNRGLLKRKGTIENFWKMAEELGVKR